MDKGTIRQEILQLLKEQDRAKKELKDVSLTRKLCQQSIYQEARTFATFLSMDFEFNTQFLIERALADGKQVLIPKTYKGGRMEFFKYEPEKLALSDFGILEPINTTKPINKAEIDLIHVPGVAWNKAGDRIGFGGGYYDRYLKDYQGSTVSTLYHFQQGDFAPDVFDVPVEFMIREKEA